MEIPELLSTLEVRMKVKIDELQKLENAVSLARQSLENDAKLLINIVGVIQKFEPPKDNDGK